MFKIYTDGATSKNGDANAYGGYAFIIVKDDKIIARHSASEKNTTNNRCELKALISACEKFIADWPQEEVIVFTDSQYCKECCKKKWYQKWMTNGWMNSKKQPVANQDLWEQLIPFFENPNFDFQRVPGHAGDYFNEIVDKMAVAAKYMNY